MSELAERIESIIQKYYGELWARSLWAGMEYAVDHYKELRYDILAVCLKIDEAYPETDNYDSKSESLRNYSYYIN